MSEDGSSYGAGDLREQRRMEAARHALATLVLEGLSPSPEARADMMRVVSGEISLDEMRRRTFERFGLPLPPL